MLSRGGQSLLSLLARRLHAGRRSAHGERTVLSFLLSRGCEQRSYALGRSMVLHCGRHWLEAAQSRNRVFECEPMPLSRPAVQPCKGQGHRNPRTDPRRLERVYSHVLGLQGIRSVSRAVTYTHTQTGTVPVLTPRHPVYRRTMAAHMHGGVFRTENLTTGQMLHIYSVLTVSAPTLTLHLG